MIERNDFIHPHWEQHWFFSKPALTLWFQAFGMLLTTRWAQVATAVAATVALWALIRLRTGVTLPRVWALLSGAVVVLLRVLAPSDLPWKVGDLTSSGGALPLATEWGVRLPFATSCIISVGLLTWALARTVSPRVGFFSGLVLMTMPLSFLLARQSVTDPLLVSATVSGMACVFVAQFDPECTQRHRWWYGAYAAFALATLAKGWLGFLLPLGLLVSWLLLFVARRERFADELRALKGLALERGLVAGVLVGLVAWNVARARGTVFMSGPAADGGVPGGPNDVLGPAGWLALTWGALAAWTAVTVWTKPSTVEWPPIASTLQRMRLGRGVLLFLALSFPWYYVMFTFDGRDEEGKLFWVRFIVHDHLSRFFAGVFTTTPGGTFTYFLEQGGYAVFPWVVLIPGAVAIASRVKTREATTRDHLAGLAALWLGLAWLIVGDSATKFHHYVFPLLPPLAMLMALFLDELLEHGPARHALALALGVPLFLLVGKDLWTSPKAFTDLFVFNYERPWPEFLVTKPQLGRANVKDLLHLGSVGLLLLVGGLLALGRRRTAVQTFALGATVFAAWFSWSHWVELSPHWTQRDLFWRYETLKGPDEPIGAFLMNWRGETFYSRNQVVQIPAQDTQGALNAFVARAPRVWFIVEHARLGVLRSALGNRRVEPIDPTLTNKFVLVRVDSG